MLRLPNEAALEKLGLPPHLLEYARQQLASPKIPDIGDLNGLSDAELWTRVVQEQANIRRGEVEALARGKYVTAARYRQGKFLLVLKPRSPGTFEAECKARGIKSQRASENMRIADHFENEAEAGKVPIWKVLKMIKRSVADDSQEPLSDLRLSVKEQPAPPHEPRNPKWPLEPENKPKGNTPPPAPKENPTHPLAVLVKIRERLAYLQEDVKQIDWKVEPPQLYRSELETIVSAAQNIAKEVPHE